VQPDWRVGAFGRVSWFSDPEPFKAVQPGAGVGQAARIRDRFDSPALDKSGPERNGN